MKDDIKKKITDLIGKIDSKVLESKINQAVEMIKNGEHEDIAKKIKNIDSNNLDSKIDDLKKLRPEELEILKQKFLGNIKNEDINKLNQNLDSNGKKILQKIITTLNPN